MPPATQTMTIAYALTIDLPQPLPTAIETLRAALAAEQMGIVSEVDVQATLKAKLGLDSPPQKLLGICSPKVAHAILRADPDMGAMLPCGCGVSEARPGVTRIALQDPSVIAAATDNAAVHAACDTATAALQRVMARLANETATPAARAP
jgi:uncharacterized protein (DUF302 family)